MRILSLAVLLLFLAGCTTSNSGPLPENYHDELITWKQDRDERLRAENGWVNLAGLYWLEDGENTFGSSEANHVVFPEYAPEMIGTITVSDSILSFSSSGDVDVIVDSTVQESAVVYDAGNEIFRTMKLGRYVWFIIERAGNYAIRLRDLEDPNTRDPLNIEYFDWSDDWRVKAVYRPFDSPQIISIDNIVGLSSDEEFAGEFIFEVNGKEYSLWPSITETYSFIMFADATSGDESYGAGRYLVADVPDENGELIIDFNRAYNPPCGFTAFATCPLPPKQNILDIPVRAGEMAYHYSDDVNGTH